jgi:hypothetical protein
MKAKIYKPAKNAMQSGRANTTEWVLEYELETPRRPEPEMGWVAADDTLNQVRIKFITREAAIAFAEKEGFDYTVGETHARKVKPQSYIDNFKYHPDESKTAEKSKS